MVIAVTTIALVTLCVRKNEKWLLVFVVPDAIDGGCQIGWLQVDHKFLGFQLSCITNLQRHEKTGFRILPCLRLWLFVDPYERNVREVPFCEGDV